MTTMAAHSYRPFEGDHDLADFLRIIVCVAGLWLIGVIGRTVLEGLRHHEMDRWQVYRFLGLAVIVISLATGSAERFGAEPNWHIAANLVGIFLSWLGVLGIRREQRNRGSH